MSHHTDRLATIDVAPPFLQTNDGRHLCALPTGDTIYATFATGDPITDGCIAAELHIDGHVELSTPKEQAQLAAFCERYGLP